MEQLNTQASDFARYDYQNGSLPRDFDIRVEVAEQKEILERSNGRLKQLMQGSEYDF